MSDIRKVGDHFVIRRRRYPVITPVAVAAVSEGDPGAWPSIETETIHEALWDWTAAARFPTIDEMTDAINECRIRWGRAPDVLAVLPSRGSRFMGIEIL